MQASRAVNQACGRVIRHLHDYGAIILADERFQVRAPALALNSTHYIIVMRDYTENNTHDYSLLIIITCSSQ
jgi:Rad3-related DNA helicase